MPRLTPQEKYFVSQLITSPSKEVTFKTILILKNYDNFILQKIIVYFVIESYLKKQLLKFYKWIRPV